MAGGRQRNREPLGCLVSGVSTSRWAPQILAFVYRTLRPLASLSVGVGRKKTAGGDPQRTHPRKNPLLGSKVQAYIAYRPGS